MAHNIYVGANGIGSMFSAVETPWHGLGVVTQGALTANEAIKTAQLDYTVEALPIMYTHNSKLVTPESIRVLVRQDTGVNLGIVTDSYKIVQNGGAFDFFDSLVGEGQAIYESAGALGKGERIWILAKLPKDTIITKEDIAKQYILLTNSHDGKSSLQAYFTSVRVVCQNTLNLSLADASKGISIRHSGNIAQKVSQARETLGLAVNYFARFEASAQAFVNYQMNTQELNKYFNYALTQEENPQSEELSTRIKNQKDELFSLFENGKGNKMQTVRGSLWAALNAVTEYVDWNRTTKGQKQDQTKHLKSIWFGTGATIKSNAYNKALELVNVH